jgi:hypothetical protein
MKRKLEEEDPTRKKAAIRPDGSKTSNKKKKKKKRKKSSNNNDNSDVKQSIDKNISSGKDNDTIIDLQTEAATYLELFVEDKDNWKFKKKIQVWLLKNAFDPSAIRKNVFPAFLKYLKGLKGISKDVTLKKAKDILEVESLLKDDADDDKDQSSGMDQQNNEAFKRQKKRARIRLKRANAIAKILS